MLLRAHRDAIDELGFADLEEGIVGREHVELFAIVGIGGAYEHRARRRQHRIAQRLQFGADGSELSALNAQIEALMRQAENCRDMRTSCKHRGRAVSHQSGTAGRQKRNRTDTGQSARRQYSRHRTAAVKEERRTAGRLGRERDHDAEGSRQRSRQSERALIERVIRSVFAFDRKLAYAASRRSKQQSLMMSRGLRIVAEKAGERDLTVVANLRAAKAQNRDLVA